MKIIYGKYKMSKKHIKQQRKRVSQSGKAC